MSWGFMYISSFLEHWSPLKFSFSNYWKAMYLKKNSPWNQTIVIWMWILTFYWHEVEISEFHCLPNSFVFFSQMNPFIFINVLYIVYLGLSVLSCIPWIAKLKKIYNGFIFYISSISVICISRINLIWNNLSEFSALPAKFHILEIEMQFPPLLSIFNMYFLCLLSKAELHPAVVLLYLRRVIQYRYGRFASGCGDQYVCPKTATEHEWIIL